MASPNNTDEARANRLASMTRTSSSGPAADPEARAFEGRARLKEGATIKRDRIIPDPNQPRTEFDEEELNRLAESLRTRGQLQPIRVRWDASVDSYVVVLGERRWRAAGLAGLEFMSCVVVDGGASPEDLLEDQLVENCLRVDLRPVELARSYQTLMTSRGLSQRALADRLHVSPASVAKAVLLLTLPEPIQAEVDAGSIGPDTAYQLSKVIDPEEQSELAKRAVAGSIRRDEIQQRTRAATKKGSGQKGRGAKLKTVETIKTSVGIKLTAERAKGIEPTALAAALREALAKVEASLSDQTEAA